MESTASRFLALADELIIDIISQIQDRQSLRALARTCSRLQDLTEDFIFDSLLIRNGDRARALARLFASGRIRPRAVHDLQIRWPHTVEDGIEDIGSVLKDFSQLRSLRIESPCCNDSPWIEQPEKPALPWTSGSRLDISGLFEIALGQSRSLEAPLLGQLQSLTLHSHGSGEGPARYELGKAAVIFLLPSLRYIMLSCFNIGIHQDLGAILSQRPEYTKARKTTGLQTLIFEECNIDFENFKTILEIPRALENLTIGERMYHTSDAVVPMGFRRNFLEAMGPQRATLKYLKHMGGGRYWSQAFMLPHFKEDISFLPALETLELGPGIAEKYASQPFPPSLLKVRFLMVFPRDLGRENELLQRPLWSSSASACTSPASASPSRHIEFVLYTTQKDDFWRLPGRRESVDWIATKLRKQNIGLAIYQPKYCKRSLIPPYMYGEELPEEELLYSSSNRNRFGGRFYELADDAVGDGEAEGTGSAEPGDEVD